MSRLLIQYVFLIKRRQDCLPFQVPKAMVCSHVSLLDEGETVLNANHAKAKLNKKKTNQIN